MKRIIVTLLTIVMLSSMFAVVAFAGDDVGVLPATDVAIEIDGLKDAIYDRGLCLEIATPLLTQSFKDYPDTTGTGWYLWNGVDTFYVYVEIYDEQIEEYEGDIPATDPWNTDSLELFFDPTAGNNQIQWRIDYKGVPSIWVTGVSYFNEEAMTTGLEKFAITDIPNGYAVEAQIKASSPSWEGYAPVDGLVIGINACINDMVDGVRWQFLSNEAGSEAVADFDICTLSTEIVTLGD